MPFRNPFAETKLDKVSWAGEGDGRTPQIAEERERETETETETETEAEAETERENGNLCARDEGQRERGSGGVG